MTNLNSKILSKSMVVASLIFAVPSITSACGFFNWNCGNHNNHGNYGNHNNHNNHGNYGNHNNNGCGFFKWSCSKPKPKPKPAHGCGIFNWNCGSHGGGHHGGGNHGCGIFNWSCTKPHPVVSKGSITGIVFHDRNNNGRQDNGERGRRGVIVSVLDANGDIQTSRTDSDGSYCINNVVVGDATVTVKESTLPINAELTVGDNPSDVTVVANRRNNAGKDGYILPQDQYKTGRVCGIVFHDANNNGRQDNNEEGRRGIIVSVLDANGEIKTAKTRRTGSYCIKNVAVGDATVTVKETTLPDDAELTVGDNPSDITVVANRRNDAGKDGYIFHQDPADGKGKVCGTVFFDQNRNGRKDAGEKGAKNIVVEVTGANGDVLTGKTNSRGYYCISNVSGGSAQVIVDDSTLPDGTHLTSGSNPTELNVVPNQNNNAGNDGYSLNQDPADEKGKVCGTVFFDQNRNGKQDAGENGAKNITIGVRASNGNVITGKTNNNGEYCISNVPKGTAQVTVDDSTLPNGTHLTSGTNPTEVDVVANQNNNAGKDGYALDQNPADEKGKVCGTVFFDQNKNGTQDAGENGAKNITIGVRASNGNVITGKTNNNGEYCISNVPKGTAQVMVDDSTLPNGTHLTSGTNPTEVDVVANQNNNAGKDGYALEQNPVDGKGDVCGSVFLDKNGNHKKDPNENGAANILVGVASKGDVTTGKTNSDGYYCISNIPAGSAQVMIDVSTLPNGGQLTSGTNPTEVNVVPNEKNDAGVDGYDGGTD